MRVLDAAACAMAAVAAVLAALRWLRVAQREHYLAGAGSRFALRWWWGTSLANRVLLLVALVSLAVALFVPPVAIAAAAAVGVGPLGLTLHGRTSKLVWTRRLDLVAAVSAVLGAIVVAAAALLGGLAAAAVAAAFVAVLVPGVVDVALFVLRPVEDLLAKGFVRSAGGVLERVHPLVVGVTGSFGKTSTKNYVAHLLGGERAVVASPRSFNNRAGLARTVNEQLVAGTDVLVAEMGAYGPGEIAALCSWLHPEVAVITAIGPAHLERFGSLERTLAAKSEILSGAAVAVLNVDDLLLSGLVGTLPSGQRVVRASGTSPTSGDVAVVLGDGVLSLHVGGELVGTSPLPADSAPPIASNVACAAAVAIELGIAPQALLGRFGTLPSVPNRLQRYPAEAGYLVLDDTFNANPTGARLALEALRAAAPAGRRVLVTPGMVELGAAQRAENRSLATFAATVVTDLVVVGVTNRAALVEGAAQADRSPRVEVVANREAAVAWARSQLGPGDAVLFENDLPDHFP